MLCKNVALLFHSYQSAIRPIGHLKVCKTERDKTGFHLACAQYERDTHIRPFYSCIMKTRKKQTMNNGLAL